MLIRCVLLRPSGLRKALEELGALIEASIPWSGRQFSRLSNAPIECLSEQLKISIVIRVKILVKKTNC